MDIGKTEGVTGPGRIEGIKAARVNPPQAAPVPAPQDRVELSQAGQLVSEAMSLPAVRTDRIAELKQMVEAGTYQTDERLLGALEKFIRENPDVL